MRTSLAVFAMALLVGTQMGCASGSRAPAPPRVAVQNIVALPATTQQQRYRVTLLIDNPNTEPLEIKELKFTLRLASEGLLDGRSNELLTVQALDQRTVTYELRSEIISSPQRLMSFVQGPANALPYELYGEVTLDRAFLTVLRFAATGQAPLAMSNDG